MDTTTIHWVWYYWVVSAWIVFLLRAFQCMLWDWYKPTPAGQWAWKLLLLINLPGFMTWKVVRYLLSLSAYLGASLKEVLVEETPTHKKMVTAVSNYLESDDWMPWG